MSAHPTADASHRAGARGVRVRDYRPEDAAATLEIFVRAILEGATRAYSDAQVRAWLGEAPRAPGWDTERRRVRTFVAERDAVVLGFADLDEHGEVDRLFTLPAAHGQGIAAALLAEVETVAREHRIATLRTHASRLARPVFERAGWVVDERELVERGGVELERFAMHRDLA